MKKLNPRDHRGHSKERDNKYISRMMQMHALGRTIGQAKRHGPKLSAIELELIDDSHLVFAHMGMIGMSIALRDKRDAQIEVRTMRGADRLQQAIQEPVPAGRAINANRAIYKVAQPADRLTLKPRARKPARHVCDQRHAAGEFCGHGHRVGEYSNAIRRDKNSQTMVNRREVLYIVFHRQESLLLLRLIQIPAQVLRLQCQNLREVAVDGAAIIDLGQHRRSIARVVRNLKFFYRRFVRASSLIRPMP